MAPMAKCPSPRNPVGPGTPGPWRGPALASAAALAALLAAGPAAAAEWSIAPRVAAGVNWTDNVTLAPKGLEDSEWITELKPGLGVRGDGARLKLGFDYEAQALWFADNSEYDDVFHQARGNALVTLAPNSLFLDAFTRYDQQNVDFGGRVAYNNLLRTDNRTDTFVFGLSPYHVGRLGAWGESLVRYQYQGVRYTNTDEGVSFNLQDADTQGVSAALGSPAGRRGFSWRASGSYTLTEFDVSPEFEYARVALDAGMPAGLRSRVTATVGRESDVAADSSKGGLDTTFWYLGYEWSPTELQTFSLRGGDRYYGTAWDASWRRRGSRGALEVAYNEEPTTSAGVLGDERVFDPNFTPGGVPSLDTRVFLRKRFAATANYDLARSTLRARAYAERRDYGDTAAGDEEDVGAMLSYDWEAAVRTRVGGTLDFSRRDFASGRSDDLGEASVRVTRELTRTVSGILRFSHFRRSSDDPAQEYRTNQATLLVQAQF